MTRPAEGADDGGAPVGQVVLVELSGDKPGTQSSPTGCLRRRRAHLEKVVLGLLGLQTAVETGGDFASSAKARFVFKDTSSPIKMRSVHLLPLLLQEEQRANLEYPVAMSMALDRCTSPQGGTNFPVSVAAINDEEFRGGFGGFAHGFPVTKMHDTGLTVATLLGGCPMMGSS